MLIATSTERALRGIYLKRVFVNEAMDETMSITLFKHQRRDGGGQKEREPSEEQQQPEEEEVAAYPRGSGGDGQGGRKEQKQLAQKVIVYQNFPHFFSSGDFHVHFH